MANVSLEGQLLFLVIGKARVDGRNSAQQAPAKPSQVTTGGVAKPQRGPVARASLRSSVATFEPRNSASAIYQASYDVRFARSSHTLGANGAYGKNSTRRSRRSACAIDATSAEISPAAAARRRILAASTGIRCGALSGSAVSSDSAQVPVLPASTSADTTSEASMTSVTGDPHPGATESGPLAARTLLRPSGHGSAPAMSQRLAGGQARRAWYADTPAMTGQSKQHGPPAHPGSRQAHHG